MYINNFKRLSLILTIYVCCQMAVLFYGSSNNITVAVKSRNRNVSRSVFQYVPELDASLVASEKEMDTTRYISKTYRAFTFEPPLFIDDKSRDLFYKNAKNTNMLGDRENDTLRGEIIIAENSTLDVKLDCGYKSRREWIEPWTQVPRRNWFKTLVPLIVPDANTFQHFLDGALPKIIQALPLLQNPSVNILMYPYRDEIIDEILDKLNISSSQLVFAKVRSKKKGTVGTVFGANRLIYPCITPPLHPDLWREGRRAMGAPAQLQIPPKQAYVVFVTRGGCHNCGRLILNRPSVLEMLLERYGKDRLRVFDGPISLQESIDLFGKAKVIMGSHGGGMYNVNFAPAQTAVIEFMPTFPNGDMGAASFGIIWAMAQMLDQRYWRLCFEPQEKNNMNVDIMLLTRILDVVDKETE